MKAKLLLTIVVLIAGNALAFAQPGTNDSTFNSTDIGFGYGHGAAGHVYSTSIQSDGKLIIGGDFWTYNVTGRGRNDFAGCLSVIKRNAHGLQCFRANGAGNKKRHRAECNITSQ